MFCTQTKLKGERLHLSCALQGKSFYGSTFWERSVVVHFTDINRIVYYFPRMYKLYCQPGSSVSIVSSYRLDDRAIEVRSPAEAKDFSSNFCVQTGSGAHPASCTMGTGGPFPGAKAWPRRDADHSPHLVPRMNRSYTSSPHKRLRGV
jgi:hypothetical protein